MAEISNLNVIAQLKTQVVVESTLRKGSWTWVLERFSESFRQLNRNKFVLSGRLVLVGILETACKLDMATWNTILKPSIDDLTEWVKIAENEEKYGKGPNDLGISLQWLKKSVENENVQFCTAELLELQKSFGSIFSPENVDADSYRARAVSSFLFGKLARHKIIASNEPEENQTQWMNEVNGKLQDGICRWIAEYPIEWSQWKPITIQLPLKYHAIFERTTKMFVDPCMLPKYLTYNVTSNEEKGDNVIPLVLPTNTVNVDPFGMIQTERAVTELENKSLKYNNKAIKHFKDYVKVQGKSEDASFDASRKKNDLVGAIVANSAARMAMEGYCRMRGLSEASFSDDRVEFLKYLSSQINVEVPCPTGNFHLKYETCKGKKRKLDADHTDPWKTDNTIFEALHKEGNALNIKMVGNTIYSDEDNSDDE